MSALQGRALASGLRRTPVHHWVVKPRRIITPSYCAPFPFNLVLPTHTSQPASAAALIGHGADGGAWRAFCDDACGVRHYRKLTERFVNRYLALKMVKLGPYRVWEGS